MPRPWPTKIACCCSSATQGERNVSELEALVGLHQPSLSQQLGVLRDEVALSPRREGKYIYYRLASFGGHPDHADAVRALLRQGQRRRWRDADHVADGSGLDHQCGPGPWLA